MAILTSPKSYSAWRLGRVAMPSNFKSELSMLCTLNCASEMPARAAT